MDDKIDISKLEFLFNILSDSKDIKVSFTDTGASFADLNSKEIFLNNKKDYNRKKSEGFQEMGHVWLSGSLSEYIDDWNEDKYGKFNDFNGIINVLEDIRTENLMSIRYPQIKNRFINAHIEMINDLLKEKPDIIAKNPRAAVYILAEDRFKIPIDIDSSIAEISKKIKSILDKSKFKENNWKHMVSTALKVCAEIKNWEDEQFGDLQDMLDKLEGKIKFTEGLNKSRLRQKQQEEDKIGEIYGKAKVIETSNKQLEKQQEEFEKLLAKHPELKKEIEDAIKDLEEKRKEKSKEIKNSEKDIDDIQKHIEELDKKSDEIYNKEYKPAVSEQTKIANDLATQKSELNENYKALPKTFQYEFYGRRDDQPNPGSGLTSAHIKEIVKKENELGVKKAKVAILGISNEENNKEDIDMIKSIKLPKVDGNVVEKNPKVTPFKTSDRFVSEGKFPMPNLNLALSSGYEIASELKRKLKLEAVVLKHKMKGKVDIKAVKRQISKYGRIIDPRIMKVTRDLMERHSVLVLTDFSGSMSEPGEDGIAKVQYAKQALVTLGKTLENLNVNYSLRGFSARSGRCEVSDVILKEFSDPHIDYKLVNKVFYPPGYGENRDGASIRHATTLLGNQRGKKLLIVISDGYPSHGCGNNEDDYEGEAGEADTKSAIREAEENGIKVMGISIDRDANNFVLEAYPNSFVFNDLKYFPRQLTRAYIDAMVR